MSDIVYLTKEKRNELEKELNELQTTGRKEMARKIAEARSHGDLSENADYDAAKEEQGLMELKISKISATLAKSQIVDTSKINTSTIQILNVVKLLNLNTKKEITYTLVSDAEADFMEMKLSVESPVGKSILGKKVGEKVEVNLPAGVQNFEVLDISI